MFCPKCGNQLPDGAKFCGACGTTLNAAPAQPAPGASGAIPQAQPAPGAPYGQAPQAPNSGSQKNILIIGGIAIVVILIALVVGLVNCAGCGGGAGYNTKDDLMTSIADDYNKLFKSDFSGKAMADFADGLINKMPPGAMDALAKQQGTSVEALKAELAEVADSSSMSSLAPYLSMRDIQFTVYDDGQASTSDLNDVNATLTAAGVKGVATNAVDLGANMTITLKEDLMGMTKGTTQTQDLGNTGMMAVQIDGKWYLWAGNL